MSDLAPKFCPITGLPFFAAIEHPELGLVPTYGGPYDSYTIPVIEQAKTEDTKLHDLDLVRHRFCHDRGCWTGDDEVVRIRLIEEDDLLSLQDGPYGAAS